MNFSERISSKTMKRVAIAVSIALAAAGGTVVASTATSSVTICVNKQTGAMRQETRGNKCKRATEDTLVINKQGPAGATGATGATGAAGASGVRITELSVCDGTDAGTVANELCKVGMTGPGGGPVFFIDYFDEYPSFCATTNCNYLEASPADIDENNGQLGFYSRWCSDSTTLLNLNNWSNRAIGAGRTNTTTADTTCTTGAIQAAADYVSPAFNGVTRDDWWLPSIGELMVMHANMMQTGVGGFAPDFYWSSSELDANIAWLQRFNDGFQDYDPKTAFYKIRPVRGF
jgi:hypothetical protein